MTIQTWDERLEKKSDQTVITQMEINFAMAEENNELRNALDELERQRDELIEALRDYLASNAGQPKLCGHNFYCICPGDRARAILAKHKED